MKSHATKICVRCTSSDEQTKSHAAKLADRLRLPLCPLTDNLFPYHLVVSDLRLEIHHNPDLLKVKVLPVCIDFLDDDGQRVHRQISTVSLKDPLPKAIGLKSGVRPTVVDATAGMGMDGVRLAWLGCKVILIERSPIIYELLQDGLKRATKHPELNRIIKDNVTLLFGDSTQILPFLNPAVDTIYLDPMYPEPKSAPRNKKEMRALRELVGADLDHERLFQSAHQSASKRVVVKRPKKGAFIVPSPLPHHKVALKSGRFDVYLNTYL